MARDVFIDLVHTRLNANERDAARFAWSFHGGSPMSFRSKVSIVSVLGTSVLMALGCSSRTASTGSIDSTAEALDAQNGGLQPMAKEAPAFDDQEVEALAPMDAT